MSPIAARTLRLLAIVALSLAPIALPAGAQMPSIDPNSGIDADLAGDREPARPWIAATPVPPGEGPSPQDNPSARQAPPEPGFAATSAADAAGAPAPAGEAARPEGGTYGQDDLIGAAEGVFGKGAEGLARLIEDILADQGQPTGYIVGREAGGAIVFGLRYGSGTLHHKIEGNKPVYWTGPSLGFDAGANAGNTFVLVYNLYDTADLFTRFPAGEGQAYFVGGLTASYLRRGDVVLIPIRMGAGLRLGVNAGYLKFSRKQRWLPF